MKLKIEDEIYACLDCDARQVVWRKPGEKRRKYHKKNLFCFVCKSKKKFSRVIEGENYG